MFRSKIDYIVVGLGNIGKEYEMTRHNMGFMVLDKMAEIWNFELKKEKFQAVISKTKILDKNILFMKPSTYMNNSGLAVVKAVNFYKTSLENVIVIYDDITLDLGKIKIKNNGSSGGHNGIKSIIELTDNNDFIRIKVGISKKPNKDYTLADWVISKFKKEEKELLNKGIKLASEAVGLIIKDGLESAMNKYNQRS